MLRIKVIVILLASVDVANISVNKDMKFSWPQAV